ncbi:Hypothetical Protein FCC1311_070372 [Hondaea fermentalgiana]|uniref:Uncharacterized protein n=1 Tax=Hondaea fermentalgiana TaxID=2315210 RepID=A0A2R5GIU6_9STRA|nr:Hypothetical Protein FCC1311_070372 [Hondaea fermentalgiana]|eukprot:GBG30817.1 Hypothetical Protein FCC1311_070372 [Hondaea fermentalgiana]
MTTARSMARVEIVAQPEAVFCNAEGPIATYLLRVAFVLRCRSLEALESLGKVKLKFGLCAEGSRETFDKFLDLRPEKSTMELSKDKMSGQVFFRVQGICSKHLKQARFKLVIRSLCSHVAGTTSAYFLVLTKRRLLRKVHRDIERVRRREVHRVIDGFLQVFTPKLLSSACLGAYMTPFLKVCGISENEAPDHGYPMLDQQPQFLGPLEEPRWFKLAGAKTMVKVESTPLAPPPSQLFGFDDTLDMHDAIPGDAFVLMDAPCTENDKDYDTDSQASCVPENEITSDDADADFFHKAEIAGQCGKKTEELKRADSLASYFDLSSWRRTSFSSHRSLTALPESGMDNFEPLRLDQVWSTSERGSHEGNDLADFII